MTQTMMRQTPPFENSFVQFEYLLETTHGESLSLTEVGDPPGR